MASDGAVGWCNIVVLAFAARCIADGMLRLSQRFRSACFDGYGAEQSYGAGRHSGKEDTVIADLSVEQKSGHRSESHGNVVGQSVIAQSLAASAARHDVNTKCVASNGDAAECHPMNGAQEDKGGKGGVGHVSEKHCHAGHIA